MANNTDYEPEGRAGAIVQVFKLFLFNHHGWTDAWTDGGTHRQTSGARGKSEKRGGDRVARLKAEKP